MQGLALAFEVSAWQCDCNIKTFVFWYKSYNNISLKIVLVIISVLSFEKFWI